MAIIPAEFGWIALYTQKTTPDPEIRADRIVAWEILEGLDARPITPNYGAATPFLVIHERDLPPDYIGRREVGELADLARQALDLAPDPIS